MVLMPLLPWLQDTNSGILLDLINPLYIAFMVVSLVVADELQYNYNPNDHGFLGFQNSGMNRSNPQGFWLGCLS